MKWTSLFVTIAFLVGLGIGFFARDAGFGSHLRAGARAADLAAIEKLRQAEVEATLRQDPQGLLDLWTEDAVSVNPPDPPEVGKQAMASRNATFHAQYPGLKVLSYMTKLKDIQIEGGMACVWGEHEGQFKLSPEASPANWHAKGFHVLRRQGDGSWRTVAAFWEQ